MPNNPVQVVLNAANFTGAPRELPVGGDRKDFYAFRDAEFVLHRTELQRQVAGIRRSIPPNELSYIKVTLNRSALAKSHRPFAVLLRPDKVNVVGTMGLGELIVEVTQDDLATMEREIEASEAITELRPNRFGLPVPYPPHRRREVGVIERFDLYGSNDRRRFSTAEAIDALSDTRRGGAYYVDLFEIPPAHELRAEMDPRRRRLFDSFEAGLQGVGLGLVAERFDATNHVTSLITIRLTNSDAPASVAVTSTLRRAVVDGDSIPQDKLQDLTTPDNKGSLTTRPGVEMNRDPRMHSRLLGFLESHPLVKRIQLPPLLSRSAVTVAAGHTRPAEVQLPVRVVDRKYPIVGVIDGGIAGDLEPWIIGRYGLLAAEDRVLEHGTFIGGLLVAGSQLNGRDMCPESDGCELVDVDILPNLDDAKAVKTYFRNGDEDIVDVIAAAILTCKKRYGVRIFNFSFNTGDVISPIYKSALAQHLDAIAIAANVIIVISAGNLDLIERDEWAKSHTDALRQLASPRGDETLQVPAESLFNIAVAAVNPPHLSTSVADAPARYSRRGLKIGLGVKPEFACYGGSGTDCPTRSSGLFSLSAAGAVIANCGTSFAAPLVAKTLAALVAQIEDEVPRETLLALITHGAQISPPLTHSLFRGLSRQLVGFGRPAPASEILETDDHSITLVFNGLLMAGKSLVFEFPWPQSLADARGSCRGQARMTLAYTPPIDSSFGAESVRVNLDARLQQNASEDHWEGAAKETFLEPTSSTARPQERYLIEHGLKWAPLKTYKTKRMSGRGSSSRWRLVVEYITRSLTVFPAEGVPFTLILTINDFRNEHAIFDEVRRELQAVGANLEAIQTTTRIRPTA